MLQGVKNKISAKNNFLSTATADAEAAKDAAVNAVKAQANEAIQGAADKLRF